VAFPLNPTNGQTAVFNGITHTYNAATNSWTRVAGAVTATTTLLITSTASSTDTTTGALVVRGGVGIGGNVNIGGSLATTGSGGSISGANIISSGVISVTSTATTTGTNTGALIVAGGVGIGGSLYVGGAFITTGTGGSITGADLISSTRIQVVGTSSSTSTTTGALTVTGGVGIGGDLYVGGNIISAGGVIGGGGGGGGSSTSTSFLVITSATNSTSTTTGALVVRGGVGIGLDVVVGGTVNILTTANSTSTTTGALTVAGTVAASGFKGVGGDGVITGVRFLTVQDIIVTGNLTAPNLAINSGTFLTPVRILNTTSSTGTTTGALVVSGGVGVGGVINAPTFAGVGGAGVITGVSLMNVQDIVITGSITAPNLAINNSGTFLTPVRILSTAESVSTTTGALVVSGGVGVGGTINAPTFAGVGGAGVISGVQQLFGLNISATGTVTATNLAVTGNVISPFRVSDTTLATSTQTGAMVVAGGLGVGGSIYAGNYVGQGGPGVMSCISALFATNIFATNVTATTFATTGTGGTISGVTNLQAVNVTATFLTIVNGVQNVFTVTNTTTSVSTQTGALVVAGGLGVGGTVFASSFATTGTGGSITDVSFMTISGTFTSTSTTTGALTVTGGVGIQGDLYVGGQIFAGNISGGGSAASSSGTTQTFVISSIAPSRSTNTGALQVVGGVGIGLGLVVGATITGTSLILTSTIPATSTQTGALRVAGGIGVGAGIVTGGPIIPAAGGLYDLGTPTNEFRNGYFDNLDLTGVTLTNISGLLGILTATTITSNLLSTGTNTGALRVTGGVGIGGNLFVGGTATIVGPLVTSLITGAGSDVVFRLNTGSDVIFSTTTQVLLFDTGTAVSTQTGALVVRGGVGVGGTVFARSLTATNLTITGTAAATNTTTGAVVITGGVGIGGDIHFSGNLYQNGELFTPSGGGGGPFGGETTSTVNILNSTVSTSTDTGALTVVGGVGIGGDLNVGGGIFDSGARVSSLRNLSLYQAGALLQNAGTIRWYAPFTIRIVRISANVGTAPGAALVVTLRSNGAGIADVSIPGAATTSSVFTTPTVVNEGNYLTVDISPVNPAASAGAELYLIIVYEIV
jgi:hypothetical protein